MIDFTNCYVNFNVVHYTKQMKLIVNLLIVIYPRMDACSREEFLNAALNILLLQMAMAVEFIKELPKSLNLLVVA